MAARRYDLVAQHGSNWRSPLWIPVVNGRRTVLADYTLRARVIEYPGDKNPYFRWTTGSPGIEIVTVKLRRADGSTFDTSGFHLELSPTDWDGKRRSFEGDLEVDIQSTASDEPRFRQKFISGRRFRVTTDIISTPGYGPEILSESGSDFEVLEYEYPDVLVGAEIVSVDRDQLEGPVTQIGDLENVDEDDSATEPTVLVRDPDTGVYLSVPTSQISAYQRGSVITYVDNVPQQLPQDTQAGDFYVVISGDSAGTVYEVREV